MGFRRRHWRDVAPEKDKVRINRAIRVPLGTVLMTIVSTPVTGSLWSGPRLPTMRNAASG